MANAWLALPDFLLNVPSGLDLCRAPATTQELRQVSTVLDRFSDQNTYESKDKAKLRAFRLLAGARFYLEIGTFDKANLAYVSQLLANDAVIIDLDVAHNEPKDALFNEQLRGTQRIIRVRGDSTADRTVSAVREALGENLLDAAFIDANHIARFVMADFANYAPLVHKQGLIFFHDIRWQGSIANKGVAQALEVIQRHVPVYQIVGDDPVCHFVSPFTHDTLWGGVGIVFASDLPSNRDS
jgi:predicted O-methyltransferase YrrM